MYCPQAVLSAYYSMECSSVLCLEIKGVSALFDSSFSNTDVIILYSKHLHQDSSLIGNDPIADDYLR